MQILALWDPHSVFFSDDSGRDDDPYGEEPEADPNREPAPVAELCTFERSPNGLVVLADLVPDGAGPPNMLPLNGLDPAAEPDAGFEANPAPVVPAELKFPKLKRPPPPVAVILDVPGPKPPPNMLEDPKPDPLVVLDESGDVVPVAVDVVELCPSVDETPLNRPEPLDVGLLAAVCVADGGKEAPKKLPVEAGLGMGAAELGTPNLPSDFFEDLEFDCCPLG